jgi:hypothetical protein
VRWLRGSGRPGGDAEEMTLFMVHVVGIDNPSFDPS